MNSTALIRFIRQTAIAMVAATCLHAYAQEFQDPGITATDLGPVADPYNPPPGNPIVTGDDVEKAGAFGPHFSALYVTTDLTTLGTTFLTGTRGPPIGDGVTYECLGALPVSYTFTLSVDNQTLYSTTRNTWYDMDSFNPPDCGFGVNFSVRGYDILQPGVYKVTVVQGGRTLATATLTLPPCLRPVPVYSAYHSAYTDNFYTTSMSQLQQAISLGYQNTGIGFSVSLSNQKTAPWKRYFIGAPQLEHFYTHLADEEQFVTSFGYVYEGNEGNVFPNQVTGTVPLYRLSQFFPATSDLEHVYTTSMAAVASYEGAGYGMDGVKGYVCQ